MPGLDYDRIVLAPTAPATTIAYSNAGWDSSKSRCTVTGGSVNGLPVTVPIPTSYVLPTGPRNDSSAFLLSNNHTLIQTQPLARCTAGGSATSIVRVTDNGTDAELYGDGRLGSHGGSKLSALGGALRIGDLAGSPGSPIEGPHHALKVEADETTMYYNCSSGPDCFRWPAFVADSNAVTAYGSANNNQNQAMKMGALLAIPPSVNITQIGLESIPGKELAWTLQNYGAYIVDSNAGPTFNLAVEDGSAGSEADDFQTAFGFSMEARVRDNTPWTRDLDRILPLLSVVDNNSPTNIGGGGIPRQPLAKPFQ